MSKLLKSAIVVAIMGSVAISPAWADRYGHQGRGGGHHRGGGSSHNAFGWGLGILAGTAVILAATHQSRAYYPVAAAEPVYWQRPVIVPTVIAPPPVHARQQDYWYYCAQAGGYYPYVPSCPAGWLRVVPN